MFTKTLMHLMERKCVNYESSTFNDFIIVYVKSSLESRVCTKCKSPHLFTLQKIVVFFKTGFEMFKWTHFS